MSSADISSISSELFSAPATAAVQTEVAYRKAWAEWLHTTLELMDVPTDSEEDLPADKPRILRENLNLAPIMRFNGVVEVAITTRISACSLLMDRWG